jgi:hypothetical protein
MTRRRLCVQDYTVGLVCALLIELATAMTMLDEEHHDLETTMTLTYTLSHISKHNVVIACLPASRIGTNSAAVVAVEMITI